MYRHHPAVARIDELLAAGEIGTVDSVHAAFSIFDPEKAPTTPRATGASGSSSAAARRTTAPATARIDACNRLAGAWPVPAQAVDEPRVERYGTVSRLFGLVDTRTASSATSKLSMRADFNHELRINGTRGHIRLPVAWRIVSRPRVVASRSTGWGRRGGAVPGARGRRVPARAGGGLRRRGGGPGRAGADARRVRRHGLHPRCAPRVGATGRRWPSRFPRPSSHDPRPRRLRPGPGRRDRAPARPGEPRARGLGVTTVAGNQTIEKVTANALRVLELAGRGDVPVAAGADQPLVGELVVAADDTARVASTAPTSRRRGAAPSSSTRSSSSPSGSSPPRSPSRSSRSGPVTTSRSSSPSAPSGRAHRADRPHGRGDRRGT